ncbi:MAG TPA: cobalamin biosynthesis protein [Xanthobacteraceae bacterium]|jgi:cobalt-precorrin 5A hydrolase
MIVAGVGCRRGTAAAAIAAVIEAALRRAGLGKGALGAIAAPAVKESEPGIAAAAAALRLPLVLISPAELTAAGARAVTRSERVVALMGVPSVAEAAALAAAGATARLLVARIAIGPATCALADSGAAP